MAAPLALAGASPGAPTRRIASRALNIADAVLGTTLVVLLAAIVANVAAGVVSRYVFNASFRWTEEVGYLLFLWLIFVGVTLAHRRRLHIALPLLAEMLPVRWAWIVEGVADFIVAYTTLVMAFSGLDAALLIGGTTPALGLPNEVRFLPLTVFAAIGLAYLVLRDVEEGRRYWGKASVIAIAAGVYAATAHFEMRLPGASPTAIMIIAFVASLAVGAPVAYALLFSAYLATWGADLLPPAAVAQNMVNGASKFILLAIPLFLLTGYLMNAGGLSERLFGLARSLVGHWRGGFAQVNVLSSTLVGGVSGSSSADAAMDSKLLVPLMVKNGYSAPFSCAITAASAILPNIIPPSIAMLIYASVAQVSILSLFLAGYFVGGLLAIVLMFAVWAISFRRGYGRDQRPATHSERWTALKAASPVLVMPLLIIGGIRYGVTTATEAGAVAVLYALGLSILLSELRPSTVYGNLRDAALDTALVGFLLAVTAPFGYVLIAERMPQQLVETAMYWATGWFELLLVINLLLLLAGMFLDLTASVLIIVPLTLPLIQHLGIDPIHYAMVVIVNLMIGGITPPVGQLVFVTSSIARVPPSQVFRAAAPFLMALLLGLVIVTGFPQLSLLLPRLLG